jgi:hypothetical protein
VRNGQLMQSCGLECGVGQTPYRRNGSISAFWTKIDPAGTGARSDVRRADRRLAVLLPDLDVRLAADSKAFASHAKPPYHDAEAEGNELDGRRARDADWGTKTYKGVHQDGTVWEKVSRWFGYLRLRRHDLGSENSVQQTEEYIRCRSELGGILTSHCGEAALARLHS